jgi:hypothetical protein
LQFPARISFPWTIFLEDLLFLDAGMIYVRRDSQFIGIAVKKYADGSSTINRQEGHLEIV